MGQTAIETKERISIHDAENGNLESHDDELAVFGDPEAHNRPITKADYDRVVTAIREKSPGFSKLNALFEVSIHPEYPSVLIDARKSPMETISPSDEKPMARVMIRPETVFRLVEGNMEPRYAVNFGHIVTHGPGRIGVKFADFLCPAHLQPSSPAPAPPKDRLPKPTEDLTQVWRDLNEHGYGMIKNALDPQQLATLRARLVEQAECERKLGVAFYDGGSGANKPNQRVWNLPNKGKAFVDLL
jgi:hypothetical protein